MSEAVVAEGNVKLGVAVAKAIEEGLTSYEDIKKRANELSGKVPSNSSVAKAKKAAGGGAVLKRGRPAGTNTKAKQVNESAAYDRAIGILKDISKLCGRDLVLEMVRKSLA